MTDAEQRERARLRSERWRRAHGIGPRRPAERPWLALGISRSTWRESPSAGRIDAGDCRAGGGVRPLAMAACGTPRESRQDRYGKCGCLHSPGFAWASGAILPRSNSRAAAARSPR
jgi:hypothetical protein